MVADWLSMALNEQSRKKENALYPHK